MIKKSTSFRRSVEEKLSASSNLQIFYYIESRHNYLYSRQSLLYSKESSPLGRTWEEWVETWWNWCYAEPEALSPAADTSGALAGKNQNVPSVWFLAGTVRRKG